MNDAKPYCPACAGHGTDEHECSDPITFVCHPQPVGEWCPNLGTQTHDIIDCNGAEHETVYRRWRV